MSVDESSSANESSSGATTPPITNSKSSTNKNLRKLKRPPAPSLTSNTNQKNLEQNGGSNHNNSNNRVPEIISNNKEVTDNNNVLGLVTCAVCGKQFGKNSVKFHTRQCQKRQQIIKERQVTDQEKKSPPSAVSEPIEEVEGMIFLYNIFFKVWLSYVHQKRSFMPKFSYSRFHA